MADRLTDERPKVVATVALSCSIVFALGLVMAWRDGVRLDRIVLLILFWAMLLALCGWFAWDIRRRRRPDA